MKNIFIGFFILYILYMLLNRPLSKEEIIKKKGELAESDVARQLRRLNSRRYKVINNVMLCDQNGTVQIDHIVISIYGIFVIETKNYSGIITGSEKSAEWTQYLKGQKNFFHNPLRQNYGHMKELMKLLEIDADKFIPIVTFSDKSSLKVSSDLPVIHISGLYRFIKGYREEKFSEEEMELLYEIIKKNNVVSEKLMEEHIQKIHENIEADETKVKEGICPKCGGKLIIKHGKYGDFYGCSNYPKCRYIRKINK